MPSPSSPPANNGSSVDAVTNLVPVSIPRIPLPACALTASFVTSPAAFFTAACSATAFCPRIPLRPLNAEPCPILPKKPLPAVTPGILPAPAAAPKAYAPPPNRAASLNALFVDLPRSFCTPKVASAIVNGSIV